MTAENARIRRRWPAAAVVVLSAGLALAGLAHAYAVRLDTSARTETLPLSARVAAGERAAALEPWNPRFEVTRRIVVARRLLADGHVDAAYFLLLPYTTKVRGDEQFRRAYRDTLEAKWPLDARKAHQQHAKEKRGGALDEADVFR